MCKLRVQIGPGAPDSNPGSNPSTTPMRGDSRVRHPSSPTESRNGRPDSKRSYWASAKGFSTLGASLALCAVLTAGGLFQLMHTIENQTKIQIDLDQCTGSTALQVRSIAEVMTQSYTRIHAFRVIALSTCSSVVTCPVVLKFADVYLGIEKTIQQSAKNLWLLQKAYWIAGVGRKCTLPVFTQKSSFPDFPFTVIQGNKSDLINPLEFSQLKGYSFAFSLHYRNLTSTAETRYTTGGIHNEWSAKWTE